MDHCDFSTSSAEYELSGWPALQGSFSFMYSVKLGIYHSGHTKETNFSLCIINLLDSSVDMTPLGNHKFLLF